MLNNCLLLCNNLKTLPKVHCTIIATIDILLVNPSNTLVMNKLLSLFTQFLCILALKESTVAS